MSGDMPIPHLYGMECKSRAEHVKLKKELKMSQYF